MEAKAILYVSLSKDLGGAETSLLTLVTHLPVRYRPLVVCPGEGMLTQELRNAGIKVLTLDMSVIPFSPNPAAIIVSWSRAQPFIAALSTLIKAYGVDLVHANSYRIGLPVSLSARRSHVPVIWHGRDLPASQGARLGGALAVSLLVDRFIVNSKAVGKAFAVGHCRHKVRVIYNGLDLAAFHAANGAKARSEFGLDSETLLIGNLGQLTPLKGQDLFLQTAAQIATVLPKAKFLIAGGPVGTAGQSEVDRSRNLIYEACLYRLAVDLGLKDRVIFAGFRRDVPDIMAALNLYLHTSRKESFGRVLIEAQACGVPVVAPALGGIPEAVIHGETGLLVPPGDVMAMAEAALILLQKPAMQRAFEQAGQERVRRLFTIERHVEQVIKVYDELSG